MIASRKLCLITPIWYYKLLKSKYEGEQHKLLSVLTKRSLRATFVVFQSIF